MILGTDPLKAPYQNGMVESLERYELHHRPVRQTVPLDLFLQMLVMEWERYRLHLVESLGNVVFSSAAASQQQASAGAAAAAAETYVPNF